MALPVNWEAGNIKGYLPVSHDEVDFLVTIEATCVTGFEGAAEMELKEKFNIQAIKHQGRLFFDIHLDQLNEVFSLRCIDNVWVITGIWPKFDFDLKETPLTECLQQLNKILLPNLNWFKGLKSWNKVFGFYEDESELLKFVNLAEGLDSKSPTFRCTCHRTGENVHSFASTDVARSFGGIIADTFGWKPKMKGYDLDVVVNIDLEQIYCGIALTKESLYHRNITAFGPTTLRATICASMLKVAKIEVGDIVVDPMCGGGSIPIEGSLTYKAAMHIGGDSHIKAVERCSTNLLNLHKSQPTQLPIDFFQWDVTRIPLRSDSVDVFVTDLPFGKRSGSKVDNRVLYPKVLASMARVVRTTSGRAVLLTYDRNSMYKSLSQVNKYWKCPRQFTCNIGGLKALVFVLFRTAEKISS